jgi:DNA (cytosine-5)-methyltransferase 1
MAQKLVEANCPYLKIGNRVPNIEIYEDEQQIRFA